MIHQPVHGALQHRQAVKGSKPRVLGDHPIDDPQGVLRVNDKLRLVPGHCDPTCNVHDWYVGVRGGVVEVVWPVSARGNGFSVASAGQALNHGMEGQPVRVKVESGRVVVGMPVGDRLVELPL